MLEFIIGMMVGAAISVGLMCILIAGRDEE
ncbi:MAG: DUF3789 domain-containing protein [Massilimicrobiota timonensis]